MSPDRTTDIGVREEVAEVADFRILLHESRFVITLRRVRIGPEATTKFTKVPLRRHVDITLLKAGIEPARNTGEEQSLGRIVIQRALRGHGCLGKASPGHEHDDGITMQCADLKARAIELIHTIDTLAVEHLQDTV